MMKMRIRRRLGYRDGKSGAIWWAAVFAASLFLLFPEYGRAQQGALLSEVVEEQGLGPQMQNLAGALADVASPSQSPTGTLASLLTSFDEWTCGSFVLQFDILRKKLLIVERAPPEVVARASDFLDKVYAACQPILEEAVDRHADAAPADTETQPAPDTPPDLPLDILDQRRIERLTGLRPAGVPDKICWLQCRDRYWAWSRARTATETARRYLARTRTRAARDYPDTAQLAERRQALLKHAAARAGMDEGAWNLRRAELREDLKFLEQQLTERDRLLERAQRKFAAAASAESRRLQAYLDCLEACREAAQTAGEDSDFARDLAERLSPRLDALRANTGTEGHAARFEGVWEAFATTLRAPGAPAPTARPTAERQIVVLHHVPAEGTLQAVPVSERLSRKGYFPLPWPARAPFTASMTADGTAELDLAPRRYVPDELSESCPGLAPITLRDEGSLAVDPMAELLTLRYRTPTRGISPECRWTEHGAVTITVQFRRLDAGGITPPSGD